MTNKDTYYYDTTPVEQQYSIVYSLVGLPNAGKSTLANALVESKITAVTPKAQTTRILVKAIFMVNNVQVILTDMPGIFQDSTKRPLENLIVKEAMNGIKMSDYIILMVDAVTGYNEKIEFLLDKIGNKKKIKALVLNKIDRINKTKLLSLVTQLQNKCDFEQCFMISALKGDGLPELKQFMAHNAKQTPWPYDPNTISDVPERLLASEITHEVMFMLLHQEVPYKISVETEKFELVGDTTFINQVIHVSSEAQKKIVIGHKGETLKNIGSRSRKMLCDALETKVRLDIFVRVSDKWTTDKNILRSIGLKHID